MKEIFNTIKNNLLYILLVIATASIGILTIKQCQETKALQKKIEQTNKENGQYQAIYTDSDFKSLKEENKELYDSLKKYKEEINFLTQFHYQKIYDLGKVEIKPQEEEIEEVKEYTYSNDKNDSINYTLKIGSTREPNWYKLNVAINDNITLVNKKVGDKNELTIQTENQAQITDVTVFSKKETPSFWKRFTLGPAVVMGYDVINKQMGITCGVGISVKLGKQ